ncbi:heterodimeric methylmalonyl-CoA mutase small subunit [Kytococcus aerolatus]|uniref:Heterodimeric methylmalonyl-CoA mutase small subunit n=1 Tax=Kytococcus aerolatus TaxID=592308 RepID=A0A212TBX6_9MICO|nr:methylmalonyl-CoA mutase family protein [Kytococcus aerolatus]SNC63360.1 heterodimeric methylmalonyl-CoA mutase small subunit [Kytococcus aerolatus]
MSDATDHAVPATGEAEGAAAPPADVGEARIALAEGFEPRTLEQWTESAAKVVNRGRPEDRQLDLEAALDVLRTRTLDDFVVEPLYDEGTAPSMPTEAPGEFPYTRGGALRPADLPWDVRQAFDDPDAAATAEAVSADLEHGVSSVHLVVGAAGLAAEDIARAVEPVLTDLAPISLGSPTGRADSLAAARALQEALAGKDLLTQAPEAATQGSFGLDPVGHGALEGHEGPVTLDEDTLAIVRAALELAEGRELAPMRAITVDTLPWHEAGASHVQEIAAAIATGIATVRLLVEAGIAARDAFRLVEFRVSATQQQFPTIARLRATRRLWAHVAGQVARAEGAEWHLEPAVAAARQHAVTGRRMITRDDPSVNILRSTIACFAAAAGGAEAITVLPHDTAAGLPDAHSRRVARNTQTVLAAESHIGAVTDPAGGAYFVEALTDHYVRLAWAYVQGLEAAGGMEAVTARELLAKNVAAVEEMRTERLATRELSVTGVSQFPMAGEEPLERRPRPEVELPEGALPRSHDALPFEVLRDRSAAAALAGAAPRAALVCVGARKDFSPRETFAANVLLVAGIEPVLVETADAAGVDAALQNAFGEDETPAAAVIAAAPATNTEHGGAVADALRAAGIGHVALAGKPAELGGAGSSVDSAIATGGDVIAFLTQLLDQMGVAR